MTTAEIAVVLGGIALLAGPAWFPLALHEAATAQVEGARRVVDIMAGSR